MTTKDIFICLLTGLLISTKIINAQWSDDPANPKEVKLLSEGFGIKAVSDGKGGLIICSLVHNTSNNKSNLFLQKLDSDGFEKWSDSGVQLSDSGNVDVDFRIIGDLNGGAYIAWKDFRKTSWLAIYVQHIDSLGNSIWFNGGIQISEFKPIGDFNIILDNREGIIVLWSQGYDGIFGQRLDKNGNKLWGSNCKKLYEKNSVLKAELTTGNTILLVLSEMLLNISLDGDILWNNSLPYSDNSRLLMEYDNEYYVSWNTLNHDLILQKFDQDGKKLFGDNGKQVGRPFIYEDFRADSFGNIFILYNHNVYDGSRFLQKVDKNGDIQWQKETTVSTTALNSESFILDQYGEPVVIMQPGQENNVYVLKYGFDGTTKYLSNNIISNSNRASNIAIINTIENACIFCWRGWSNNQYKIYATKINEDGTLTNKNDVVLGIDISHMQNDYGPITWSGVVSSGIKFVFVKASESYDVADGNSSDYFLANIQGAKNANLLVGTYHLIRPDYFKYPNDLTQSAIAEAQYFLSRAGNFLGHGYLPPAIDVEKDYGLTSVQLSKWIRTWINYIQESKPGVVPIIYTSRSILTELDNDLIKDYFLWVTTDDGDVSGTPSWNGMSWPNWKFKQYRFGESGGRLSSGITGPVDLDSFNGDLNSLIALTQLTTVELSQSILPGYYLAQNYPNPFNPTTTIKFSIPTSPVPSPYQGEGLRERLVTLKVYDLLGREITTLVNEEKAPGEYSVEFRMQSLPSGVYFYRLTAGSFSETKKMILLK